MNQCQNFMDKKILFLALMFMLTFSLVSASVDFDNNTYVIDTIWPTWLGSDGESVIQLIDNTDTCLIDCSATIKFTNEKPVRLLDDFNFINRVGTEVGDRLQTLSFKLGKYETVTHSDNIYETTCEEVLDLNYTNGSTKQVCTSEIIGINEWDEEILVWTEYNNEEVEGISYLKIDGKKKIGYDVDWVIEFRGEALTEWAWWDTDWTKKREITGLTGNISALYNISYSASMEVDFVDIRFVDSTETVELNYSIINKVDSSYAQVRVDNLAASSIYMYYGNSGASDNSNYSDVIYNPLSAWTFDNGITDDVGSNDLTNAGATNTTGMINFAYDFDGTNDYFSTGASIIPTDDESFSVGLWVYPHNVTGAQIFTLISETTNNIPNPFSLNINGWNSDIAIEVGCQSPFTMASARSGVIVINNWYHVVGTYDGSNVRLYINGSLVGTTSWTTNLCYGGTLYVGRRTDGQYFDGVIDEPFIYDRALTLEEIGKLYTMNLPAFTVGSEEANLQLIVNLNSPTEAQNFTNNSINFNCTTDSPTGVYQLNFSIDGVLNQTVTGNGTTNLSFEDTIQLVDGSHNYTCSAYDDSDNVNGTKLFSIDTTPFIEFISPTPANGSNISTSSISTSLNISSNYINSVNIRFYNSTGLYQQWTQTSGLWNFGFNNGGNDGTYYLNATVNTTTGQENSTETRTYFFDTTGPEINITSPLSSYSYLYNNRTFNLTYNIIDSAGHLDSCWYIYNNITTNLNCSSNTTFNYNIYINNITVYANDTFGNENYNTLSWLTDLIIIDEVYDEQTFSTKYNNLTLVTWINMSNVSTNSALVFYNNATTFLTSSNTGNYYNFTSSSIISADVIENKTFYFNVSKFYIGNTEEIQLPERSQIINPILVKLCNSTFNISSVNFTVYTEGTSTELNSSVDFLINYWIDGDGSTAYQQFNLTDNNENKSTFEVCISDETQSFTLDGLVNYYRTDSDSRNYLLTDFLATNDTQLIPLYLEATNLTDIVTVSVIDENRNFVENANIYVQRWDIGTNTFSTVAIIVTNDEGEGFVNLNLYDVYYRFVVYYEDVIRKTTTPEKLFDAEKQIPIIIQALDNYQPFTNIATSLTFNEVNDVVSYSFVDSSGALSQGCLYVYNMTTSGNVLLSSECSTSVSSTLSYLITSNNTYFVKGVLTLNSVYEEAEQIDTLIIDGILNDNNDVIKTYGYMISFLLLGTIIAAGISMGKIEIALVGLPVVALFVNFMGWLNISTTILYSIISLCVLILILGGLKK